MAGGDREKALDAALANIERQFGKGSVMRLGDETRAPLEVIPTGRDRARRRARASAGCRAAGSWRSTARSPPARRRSPCTRWPTPSAAGGIVAFIDAEHALDPDYAKALGVDTDALLVSQPDSGEQALEIADMLIRSGALDLIVIDSVAALVPRAEIEGEMGDSHVGLQARLMSQALRKMTGALNGAGTTMIFINQLREKIGVMFGSPETTTGGRALKFYSSVRLDVRRIETLKDGQEMVGNRTRVKVVKNKVAPPFKQAEFDIMYGQGISREGGLIDVGVEAGLVRKAGAWYTYEGDQLGQGKENARDVPARQPRPRQRAREADPREARRRAAGRREPRRTPRRRSSRPASTSEHDPTIAALWSRPPRRPAVDAAAQGIGRAACRHRPDAPTRRPPEDAVARAGGRPRGGGPQDPARPAHRAGPQPCRAGDASWPRRASPTSRRRAAAGPVRGGRPGRRRGVRPGLGAVPAGRQGSGPPGAGPGAAPQGRRRRGRPGGARRGRPGRRGEPRPARWSGASCAPSRGSDRDVAVRRLTGHAGPQGISRRPVLPGGP